MPNKLQAELTQSAQQLAELLAQKERYIVFAESCTAGLVSATLAQIPGVSKWHCGSAVVYREATKSAWLAIPPAMIEKHGVVSAEVAQLMAAGVLQFTAEADISAAITGHLGPDSPPELDGVVFLAVASRAESNITLPSVERIALRSLERVDRQQEAALAILATTVKALT